MSNIYLIETVLIINFYFLRDPQMTDNVLLSWPSNIRGKDIKIMHGAMTI